MLSEQQLIEGCLKNNRRTQKQLYDMYASKFLGMCMRYAKDRQEAEDIIQEGFLKIFARISQYSGLGSFEGWMKKTMVNTSLDYIKSKKFDKVDIDDINYLNEELFVENEAASNINSEDIMKMIQELPNASKIVFNMYIIEGYKHKEISELLNISEGTSHWHLQNARKLLMNKINNLL